MIIYHGSTEILQAPRILQIDKGKDFGTGFYTTDIKEQAVRWAQRKARADRRYRSDTKAIVNIYEFDETAYNKLKSFHFADASLDWINMIIACRKDAYYSHGFDIVSGKIANDNVGETIQYVLGEPCAARMH